MMKGLTKYIAIALLLIPGAAGFLRAGTIGTIEISGNSLFTEKKVIHILGWEEGGEWNTSIESTGVWTLLNRYAEKGFLEAEGTVKTVAGDGETVMIELFLEEGELLPLRELQIEGSTLLGDGEIRKRFETRPGSVIDPGRLERDGEDLLHWYAQRGHPFGRLLITGVQDEVNPRGFGLSLLLVEGPYLELGDITVSGNHISRPSTVRRLSGLRFNEPYDQQAVDESRERLLRSGLFMSVSEPVTHVEWKKKEAVVEFELEEARTNRIEGVFGYAPGDGDEDGVLSGYVNLSFRNIMGTARAAEINWQQTAPGSRQVRLAYREPWLFGSPFAIGGSAEQTLRDSSWSRSSGSLEIDMNAGRRIVTRFAVGAESMRPRDDDSPVPRSGRRWGSVGIIYDGRNHPLNPTRGIYVRFDPEYGERRIEEEESRGIKEERNRQATMNGSFRIYSPIRQSVVIAAEVEGWARFTDAPFVPFFDQLYLGGANTLRGYEEDQFLGSRIGWSRLEIRRILGRLSRVFLFLDYGYIYSRREEGDDLVSDEQWKRAFGLGIRVESGIGIIGIDYGLGEGDGFQDGKVHVGAAGQF